MYDILCSEVEEIMDVVKYLETKSQENPKDVATEKRNERRQQRALKAQAKKKKKKGITIGRRFVVSFFVKL